jgi:hypothetical protein
MSAEMTAETDGSLLLNWLRVLGWTVEVDGEGSRWAGLATNVDSSGGEVRIDGFAASRGALAWELFSGVIRELENRDRTPSRAVQAA